MATLRELERRIARLEGMFQRGVSVSSDALTGAVPETRVQPADGSEPGEPAQVLPFPGCLVAIPPLCSVVIANATADPIVLGGAPTLVALAALQTRLAEIAAAGGVIIADPATGTGGVVITPGSVDVIGVLKVGGTPINVP